MTRGKLLYERVDRYWPLLLIVTALILAFPLLRGCAPPDVRAVADRPQVATASADAARSMEQRADRITAALTGAVPAGEATLDHCRTEPRPFGLPRYGLTYCVRELTRYLGFDGDFAATGTTWDRALLERHWTPSDGAYLDGNLRLTVQRVDGPADLPGGFRDLLAQAAAHPGAAHVVRDHRPMTAEQAAAEVFRTHRHLAAIHLSLTYYRD